MKSHFFYSCALSFSLFINFSFASISETETVPKVTVRVHAVGQGNCVTLEVRKPNAKKSEFMLIDIGSKSFNKESQYTNAQAESSSAPPEEKNQTNQSIEPSTPPSKTREKEIPESTIKESDWEDVLDTIPFNISYQVNFIKDMREMLKKNRTTISVKTVIITHPDEDHYNWLMELFHNPVDEISFLIFGGLPSHYYPNDQQNFKDWLKFRQKNGTQIFFPAIQHAVISSNINDPFQHVIDLENQRTFASHISSRDPSFTELELAKAFYFHQDVTMSLLSINPMHLSGLKRVTRLSDGKVDDNKDSLVLKIEHGLSSIMLTGDATQATTNRIIQNYEDNDQESLEFLKSTVLLASHHGSAEHGCNTEEWLSLVDPKCVAISHGHQHGHPQAKAYNRFKQLNLVQVSEHPVLVGKGTDKKDEYYEGCLHTTYRAIYSTLNSGTLTFDLQKKILKVCSEHSSPFDIPLEELQHTEEVIKDDKEIDVDILEGPEKIFLSAKKRQNKKVIVSSPVRKMVLSSSSSSKEEEDSHVSVEEETDTIASRMKKAKRDKTRKLRRSQSMSAIEKKK